MSEMRTKVSVSLPLKKKNACISRVKWKLWLRP